MKLLVIVTVICALVTSGCAGHYAAALTPAANPARSQVNTGVMSKYVAALPAGSRVRVELSDGRVVKGTLMSVESGALVLQARSRLPEAPQQIPLASIDRVEIEQGSSVGKAIAIGAGAGVAAAFGVFLLILATLED